jgi:hypothetical protein
VVLGVVSASVSVMVLGAVTTSATCFSHPLKSRQNANITGIIVMFFIKKTPFQTGIL